MLQTIRNCTIYDEWLLFMYSDNSYFWGTTEAPKLCSYALCVVPGSSSAEDARAKELEASAPVHLPFQQFQARDLPLDLALTPSHG